VNSSCEILIVDDSPANIDILSGLLDGYQRRVAIDGEAALRLAQARPPDLILLDVRMPAMDGFEVCRRLHAHPATMDVPVIFITALGDVHNESRGFEAGGVDYITKPFNASVVRSRVQTHLELKATRDALRGENARLEAHVKERTAELQIALDRLRASAVDTILRLGLAGEYRDDQTGRHVLRMAHYAVAVAQQLGWTHEALDQLFHAALMHDLGKLALPDSILHKSGPLDTTEWSVMKRHPIVGARILSGSDSEIIRLAEIVALTHHEKWDGSGYPRGLKGNDIPLVGRIVAICDVFDALTVRRPYKEALPLDEAYAILRLSSAVHFDPAVVRAFFAAETEVLRVHDLYGDNHPERTSPPAAATHDGQPSAPHTLPAGESSANEVSAAAILRPHGLVSASVARR
jgi:putative two-component system response regulator